MKPNIKPQNPHFASGPCAKYNSWQLTDLEGALIGRSHRSKAAIQRIEEVIALTRQVLEIPDSYHVALISGSATGAMECLLWNFLGNRPVDVFAWDVFGQRWADDINQELKLDQVTVFQPGTTLAQSRARHDVVFTWNATTSGTCVSQNIELFPSEDRLVLCDATSAVFAVPLLWNFLDATAFSWQKGLGGEAGQGVIILSPKAMKHLATYKPNWPIPYLFRLSQDLQVKTPIFQGQTLNTISMLVLEDAYQALKWCQEMGGMSGLYKKTLENFNTIKMWVEKTPWIDFLETRSAYRSPTSICLKFTSNVTWDWIDQFYALIEQEQVGFDLKNHRRAPPSLRIWAGPTVEKENIEALLPWLTWAYNLMK
ncbi:MAG: phosphoserine transaminase [Janthinobacterium lividum]